MRIIKLKQNNYEIVVKKATEILTRGGVVVHPTNTCYGIAADIFNKKAIDKVYTFKERGINKPLSIIVKNKEQFKKYGNYSKIIEDFLGKGDEKMYTFVVKKTKLIPKHFNPNFDSIGIQIPQNIFSLKMLNELNFPLTATSANISNKKNVYKIKELLNQIKNHSILPDLIVDGGCLPLNLPSTIIKIKNSKYIVLRN